MRKYLATIFGVAVGVATAVLVAARSDDQASFRTGANPDAKEGGS